jgi:hypothetical protein
MYFIGSLALVAAAGGLLYFGRGRGGDALPIFRNWLVGQLFGIAILILFCPV